MLYDDPPHAVSVYSVTTSRDGGGGTANTYALQQSAVPCSINSASASEQAIFAQQGIRVSVTVAFLASSFTTAPVRGVKLVDDSTGLSYHVEGINAGQAYGSVPALTYLYCSQQL